jgi:hypothetical protein
MIKVFKDKRCIKDCNSLGEALSFLRENVRIGEFSKLTKDMKLKSLEGEFEIKEIKR